MEGEVSPPLTLLKCWPTDLLSSAFSSSVSFVRWVSIKIKSCQYLWPCPKMEFSFYWDCPKSLPFRGSWIYMVAWHPLGESVEQWKLLRVWRGPISIWPSLPSFQAHQWASFWTTVSHSPTSHHRWEREEQDSVLTRPGHTSRLYPKLCSQSLTGRGS